MPYIKPQSAALSGGSHRSGKAAVFLLIVMPVVLMLVMLPINSQLMVESRTAQQNASDAASLAAVLVLVDDLALTNNPSTMATLIANAKTEAVRIAGFNFVAGKPLELQSNDENDPENDIVFAVLSKPENKNLHVGSLANSQFLTAVNTVRITARKSCKRGNEIHLIGGRLFCLSAIDLITVSTATLDCFVIGFRNHDNIAIPIIPIAIKSGDDEDSWESKIENAGGTDQFAFDPQTRTFQLGSDGLREMKVYLPADSGEAVNARYLQIGTDHSAELCEQIGGGITKDHIERFGRELIFPNDLNRIAVPTTPVPDDSGNSIVGSLREELEKLQSNAKVRIWPLFPESELNTVSRFVAARIIAVEETGGRLCVWLQPAKLATSTAVTDSSRQSFAHGNTNLYICRARLVE